MSLVSSQVRAGAWCSNFDQNLNLWPIYRWILSSQILWVENKAGANLWVYTTNSLNWKLQTFSFPSFFSLIIIVSNNFEWACFLNSHLKNAMNASAAFQTLSHKNDTKVFFRIIAHFWLIVFLGGWGVIWSESHCDAGVGGQGRVRAWVCKHDGGHRDNGMKT